MGKSANEFGFRQMGGSVAAVAILTTGLSLSQQPPPQKGGYERDVLPVIRQFCVPCHQGKNAAGDLNLSQLKSEQLAKEQFEIWPRVVRNMQSGVMPPSGSPKPRAIQIEKIANWVRGFQKESDCDLKDPGRVTLRRLNRAEYNATIQDLVGIDFHPADDFPSDDVGYGFDNIGDVLTVSPLLVEKYLDAAEQIAARAIVTPRKVTKRYEGPNLQFEKGSASESSDGAKMLFTFGEVSCDHDFPESGDYVLRVKAWGVRAGKDLPKMAFRINGSDEAVVEVAAERGGGQWYEIPIKVSKGRQRLGAAFTNDYYMPSSPNPKDRDRNLAIDSIEIVGPLGKETSVPKSHALIMVASPSEVGEEAAARTILGKFAKRAFRRPVAPQEAERLLDLYKMARQRRESFEGAIRVGVQAILVSPHFLFHVEADGGAQSSAIRPISNWELASRLSYFLWSSMPDDELFALAERGALSKPEVLRAQTLRMLRDPRAVRLSENFAAQWLQLRKLAIVSPDSGQFPEFDDTMRDSMRRETLLFFDEVVRSDRSVIEFINGKFSYVDAKLAKLYGLKGVSGDTFQRVSLEGKDRFGVLTHASVLTVTSNPTRTSPVKRGKWILENFLGTPPPPPPPGAGNLEEGTNRPKGLTLRQQLEEHRKNPECASCHARLDPLGFGFENFDPIGRWREFEAGNKVVSSGVLPSGLKFSGVAELVAILSSKKSDFVRCLTEKLLIYGLGRGLYPSDACILDEAVKRASKNNYRFSSVISAIVESDAFLFKRGAALGAK